MYVYILYYLSTGIVTIFNFNFYIVQPLYVFCFLIKFKEQNWKLKESSGSVSTTGHSVVKESLENFMGHVQL